MFVDTKSNDIEVIEQAVIDYLITYRKSKDMKHRDVISKNHEYFDGKAKVSGPSLTQIESHSATPSWLKFASLCHSLDIPIDLVLHLASTSEMRWAGYYVPVLSVYDVGNFIKEKEKSLIRGWFRSPVKVDCRSIALTQHNATTEKTFIYVFLPKNFCRKNNKIDGKTIIYKSKRKNQKHIFVGKYVDRKIQSGKKELSLDEYFVIGKLLSTTEFNESEETPIIYS